MAVADKGHYVMYTTDGTRFEVPLSYLGMTIFRELLRMSQEFGFVSGVGRLGEMLQWSEKAFLSSMAMPCHYASCMAPFLGVN
jgi:hypothetical protein